jgi:uncharacterized protein with HEPN domain
MDERILKWLFDIREAINEIDSYLVDRPIDFEDYKSNILLKRAIERDLEIIGEAMSRILKADPDFPIVNAKRITGLRNQIIHAYDSISDENIWAIVFKHIPVLKLEVEALISNTE